MITSIRPAQRSDLVIGLDEGGAGDPSISGAKAANLARAAAAGLHVLPGFVLTTDAPCLNSDVAGDVATALRPRWEALSESGERPLVVRSSSTVEDADTSSMAGRFVSRTGIIGWSRFLDAVAEVQRSADRAPGPGGSSAPMAVLVQPAIDAVVGGVLFGLDPVSGDVRRLLVEAVPGTPETLVNGSAAVEQTAMGRWGHRRDRRPMTGHFLLSGRDRRRLARLSRRLTHVFGSPQDAEWAKDHDGRLWLLQSRPVTAVGDPVRPGSPLLGPGPVGETLPDPLTPLEVDLWVEPLRIALTEALLLTRSVSPRRLRSSPLVMVVEGRAVCDLRLLGAERSERRILGLLDPRRGMRHLISAWRIGHLRARLAPVAGLLVEHADGELRRIGALDAYSNEDLLEILARARRLLVPLHVDQILAGMVLDDAGSETAASEALRVLAAGRAEGRSDGEIIERSPVVLALSPPTTAGPRTLPRLGTLPTTSGRGEAMAVREQLRLRARWVQELTSRVVWTLGRRLGDRGPLREAADVRWLQLAELVDVVRGGAAPADLPERVATAPGPPLPTTFHLTETGRIVAVRAAGARGADGVPVGGGRGFGRVCAQRSEGGRSDGEILVVRTLDPSLAAELPGLAGLLSESGGALSHLAILAREQHVPVVVGVPDAVRRFPPGTSLVVDGDAGTIEILETEAS